MPNKYQKNIVLNLSNARVIVLIIRNCRFAFASTSNLELSYYCTQIMITIINARNDNNTTRITHDKYQKL